MDTLRGVAESGEVSFHQYVSLLALVGGLFVSLGIIVVQLLRARRASRELCRLERLVAEGRSDELGELSRSHPGDHFTAVLGRVVEVREQGGSDESALARRFGSSPPSIRSGAWRRLPT